MNNLLTVDDVDDLEEAIDVLEGILKELNKKDVSIKNDDGLALDYMRQIKRLMHIATFA
jgi:hypothetical protein